ncbi:hypothetical protein AA15669_0950 [Saccharibacter floricola DSM 15669]|uniref:Uncharacterized protein n=1 Tax=Saccharibacter floricola DSM 15669 TaxID=1123227 RepID=A0ABQ0NYX7_9PROT|nr:hypothetical protein AA15669_0950 [Saccharibacter floricola DSM 15669]
MLLNIEHAPILLLLSVCEQIWLARSFFWGDRYDILRICERVMSSVVAVMLQARLARGNMGHIVV